jgi:hypothetical protein
MSSIIKGLDNDKHSVLLILTVDDVNVTKNFIASLKDGDTYSLTLQNLKEIEKELFTHIKVYDLSQL